MSYRFIICIDLQEISNKQDIEVNVIINLSNSKLYRVVTQKAHLIFPA